MDPPSATGFVGRQRELEELDGVLEVAASGRGGSALLTGEPGIGKSALLHEVGRRAEARSFVVARGKCWEQPGSPPMWAWAQILRQLLHTPEGWRSLGELGPDGALVRDLARAGLHLREHEETSRFVLFDAVARLVAETAATRPVLLALDDLHAADDATLLLLEFVTRTAPAGRAVVVAAARPVGGEREELLARIAGEGLRVPLPPMSAEEAGTLFSLTSGTSLTENDTERLLRATGGNALLVRELALVARERRSLDLAQPLPVSEAVRATVHLRIGSLGRETVEALRAAAVLGRDADERALAAITDVPLQELQHAVQEAVNQRILLASATGWSFAHDLIRQVLYDDLTPSQRATLHLRAADALERLADNAEDHAAEIAHHLLRATGREVRERAVALSRRAGDVALQGFSYETAEGHYRNALSLLDPGSDDLVGVLIDLARAQLMQGRKADGRATCLEASAIAEGRGDVVAVGRALAALSENRYVSKLQADEELIGLVDRVLRELPRDEAALRNSLVALRAMELWLLPDEAARDDRFGEIRHEIEAARAREDQAALAQALKAFCIAAGPDDLEGRLQAAQELCHLAAARGLPGSELIARASLLGCLLEKGDAFAFDEELAHLVQRAERLQHPLHLWIARSTQTAQAAVRGDFEAIQRLANEALEYSQQAEYGEGLLAWTLAKVCVGEHRGTLIEAQPLMQAAREMAPGVVSIRTGLAVIAVESGRPDEAVAELGPLIPRLGSAPRTLQWLFTVGLVGRAAAGIGDRDLSAPVYEMLVPYRDRHHFVTIGQPVSYHGSIAHICGRLAAVLGREDEAVSHFETALAAHQEIGSPPWTAWTQYELGRLLSRQAGTVRDRGERLLDAAAQTARRMDLAAITAGLEASDRRPPRPRAQPRLALVAEGDYWSVERDGAVFRMRDMRGLHYLAILCEHPDREFHALDLLLTASGAGAEHGRPSAPGGAEALLDPAAKAAYKRRIDELREEVDDAAAAGDLARRDRAQDELDFIVDQLSSAMGLKQRDRKWSDPGERARVSVTKSIKRAIANIGEHDQELRRFLEATVDTGTYCCFKGSASGWEVTVTR